MTVEPLTPTAPRPVGSAVFHQQWRDLSFLHWPADPALVAPLLPPGTRPDLLDGQTWVGLVPFVMTKVRILGTPALPFLSTFPETNVRLYAVDDQGRRGVVFRSLEAARLLPVLAARASYHLPYLWARMSVAEARALPHRPLGAVQHLVRRSRRVGAGRARALDAAHRGAA